MKFRVNKDIYFILKAIFAAGVIVTSLSQLFIYGGGNFSDSLLGNISILFLAFEFTVIGIERQKKHKDRLGQVFSMIAMFLVFYAVSGLTKLYYNIK